MRYLLFITALTLAGCADFPALDGTVSNRAQNAAFPRLLPMDTLLAQVPARDPARFGAGNLPGRARALQARARVLRGHAVIDPATRARLMQAVARHN